MAASDITSSTATAEIYGYYVASQNYDLDGSTTQARDFIRSARALLAQIAQGKAKSVSIDGNPVTFDAELLERQIKAASDWLSANDATFNGSMARRGSHHHYNHRSVRD